MAGLLGAIGAGVAGGAGIAIVISAVDNFSKTFKNINTKLAGAGVALTAMGAIGVAAMGGLVKQAISAETAFIGVRKTVDLSEEGFKDLEDRFRKMTKVLPFTFEELSRIGEIAGQLGVDGVDNIAIFTKTVADISATTNLTAEQAATDFARFANIMQMPIEDVNKLGSVVVDLGNNLATTEAEIVEMSMRIAGAGRALNMSEGEVMGWAAALTSLGIKAQMGGTAISKLMINISALVSEGGMGFEEFAKISGKTGDELTEAFEKSQVTLSRFAEVAGVSVEEFSKLFKEDASKAMQIFFEGLGRVKDGGGDVLAVLADLGIEEVRLRDAVLRLSGAGDTLNTSLGIQAKAWEENTALSNEAEKRYKSMESQIQMMKNSFKVLAAELGEVLFPILTKLIEKVTKVIEWFSNLGEGTKKFIVIGGLLASALALVVGPLLILLAMLPAIATGAAMVGTAFSVLLGPIGLVIAAVIALGALAYTIWKNWDEIGEFFKRMWEGIKDVTGRVVEWLKQLFLNFTPTGLIIKHWEGLGDFFNNLWENIKQIFWKTIDIIKSYVMNFTLQGLIIKNWEGIVDFFKNLWENIKQIFWKTIDIIKSYVMNFTLQGLIIKNWEGIVDFFKNLWDGVKDVFDKTMGWMSGLFPSDPAASIKKAWETLSDFFKDLWEGIKNVFVNTMQWAENLFSEYNPARLIMDKWDKLSDSFETLWEGIKDKFKNTMEWMRNLFEGFSPGSMIKDKWEDLSDFFEDMWDDVIDVSRDAINWMKDKWDGLEDFFKDLWRGIERKFESGVNRVIDVVEDFVNYFIKGINYIIKGLNKISVKVPSWVRKITGMKSFGFDIDKVSYVSLPRLAEGGIVRKPTIAMLGEEGPEAVVPLNKGGMQREINIYIDNLNGFNARDIADRLQMELNKKITL
jgi:TP901 family phage tail tape measure protein